MNRIQTLLCALAAIALTASAQTARAPHYNIYTGNTHSHTQYTWSHGAEWTPGLCKGIAVYSSLPATPYAPTWADGYVSSKNTCPAILVINGMQYPGSGMKLRPDWKDYQGPPSRHYELAKQAGYDFYVTSDHSQEATFWPDGANHDEVDNPAWVATKQQAAAATDANFVALAGYEFSENQKGPGGSGHINVINAAGIYDALAPGVDLPHLYKWLETAKPNGSGPIVVSFNHPGPEQYDDWANRDPRITNIITVLEVINSNIHIHYEGFVNALDKGWKVSPVSGMDNHGTMAIGKDSSRTFVLATAKTKVAILDAMRHRRTYASLDKDIQCRYTVNGQIMGSTLDRPSVFKFNIQISDPDTTNPKDKITKIDIIKDHGAVVETYTPDQPAYTVTWQPTVKDTTSKYFFIRVWDAGGGDSPKPDATKPMAWLAPVWTGR